MPSPPPPKSHLPLTIPVHQILLSVADRDRHGYAIIQDIAERTGGEVELTASTLYGALSRMLADHFIAEVKKPTPDPQGQDSRRRYYRVTSYGKRVARAEARRLARALDQAQDRGLGPGPSPQTEHGRA